MNLSDAASPRFTLDTNLLVYSVDLNAGIRYQLALCIIDKAPDVDCWLTLQSLSEFYAVVTRKRLMPAVRRDNRRLSAALP
jgi:predicted nucleic acid-binding protein